MNGQSFSVKPSKLDTTEGKKSKILSDSENLQGSWTFSPAQVLVLPGFTARYPVQLGRPGHLIWDIWVIYGNSMLVKHSGISWKTPASIFRAANCFLIWSDGFETPQVIFQAGNMMNIVSFQAAFKLEKPCPNHAVFFNDQIQPCFLLLRGLAIPR